MKKRESILIKLYCTRSFKCTTSSIFDNVRILKFSTSFQCGVQEILLIDHTYIHKIYISKDENVETKFY